MTFSASFAFAPDEKVQLKEAPHVSGKVVGMHIDRNKTKSIIVRTTKTDGEVASQYFDEDELEAAVVPTKEPVKEPTKAEATKEAPKTDPSKQAPGGTAGAQQQGTGATAKT
jgi:hypothetical protein